MGENPRESFGGQTGVVGDDGRGVGEIAALGGQVVGEVVAVEGEGGPIDDVPIAVAGPATLDRCAIDGARARRAGPVHCRLEIGVVGVVLGHAPQRQLLRAGAAVDVDALGIN